MSRCFISLLVPSYNRPDLLPATVDSLVENLAPDVEIIISDDRSPKQEEIRQAMAPYVARGQVTMVYQQQNLGWSNNRNSLVDHAKGEFVMLLGDDDFLKANAITRLRKWIQDHPGADMYGFGYDIVDLDRRRVYTRQSPSLKEYRLGVGEDWKELFYFDALPMWSHHPFTMALRTNLARTIRFNPIAGVGDDVLFLFEALQHGAHFVVIPEVFFEWRKVMTEVKGYINLSSQGNRSVLCKRQIWLHLLKSPSVKPEVHDLIRTRLFVRRFLQLRTSDADALVRRITQGHVESLSLETPELAPERAVGVGLAGSVGRLCRVSRVLGVRHFFNVIQFYLDRQAYRRSTHLAAS